MVILLVDIHVLLDPRQLFTLKMSQMVQNFEKEGGGPIKKISVKQ